jgi:hypothetical protein
MRRKGNVACSVTEVKVSNRDTIKLNVYNKVRKSVSELVKVPKDFSNACAKANVRKTSRQLNKWNRHVGAAWNAR